MNLPHTDLQPDDPDNLPPARRRRARRLLAPLDADERAELIDDFAHRVSPNFDFYFFSLISGLVISLGLLSDLQALIFLGVVLSPLLSPAIGISLGIVVGSARLFLRNLVGLLLASCIVFGVAYLAGFLLGSKLSGELALAQAHTRLSWPNFLVLSFGSVFTTVFFIRREDENHFSHAAFASIALAYALYLPLACAGIGLGARLPYLWPDGLVIFLVYLVCGILLGALTLAVVGFKPLTPYGYTIGGAVALLAVVLLLGMGSFSAVITARIGLPTATFTLTSTATATSTFTLTPVPPTATHTVTLTPSVTPSPTLTPTLTPTPVMGLVRSDIPTGARIRSTPGGETSGFLAQNTWVVILPGVIEKDGIVWIQVLAPDGIQGWIVQDLVLRITPTPISTP